METENESEGLCMRIECPQQIQIIDDFSKCTSDDLEKIKNIQEELNRRIQENDECFTIEEVYRFIGIDTPKLPPHVDQDFFKTYGWDRKGFRQLYDKVTTYIPIK